jgi:hypothetical protein
MGVSNNAFLQLHMSGALNPTSHLDKTVKHCAYGHSVATLLKPDGVTFPTTFRQTLQLPSSGQCVLVGV